MRSAANDGKDDELWIVLEQCALVLECGACCVVRLAHRSLRQTMREWSNTRLNDLHKGRFSLRFDFILQSAGV